MKKIQKKSMTKKWLLYGLIPAILFAVWAVLTLFYITSYDKSFLILSNNHSKNNFTDLQYDKLLSGDNVRGEFTATENNLGIVSVRFSLYSRVPYKQEDVLTFRIKEKGSNVWYYESNYRAGLIYDVPLFPFGFPKIAESQGKQYVFEIVSLNGNQRNAVSVSKREPILISKYETSKAFLLADKKEFMYFTLKKFNGLKTTEVMYVSFIFLLPLVMYFLLITPQGQKVSSHLNNSLSSRMPKWMKNKSNNILNLTYLEILLLSMLLIMIISDIFIFQLTYAAVYIVLIGIWTFILVHSANSKVSFATAGMFLSISILFYYSYYQHVAEYISAWAFLFLCSGVIQALAENTREK